MPKKGLRGNYAKVGEMLKAATKGTKKSRPTPKLTASEAARRARDLRERREKLEESRTPKARIKRAVERVGNVRVKDIVRGAVGTTPAAQIGKALRKRNKKR